MNNFYRHFPISCLISHKDKQVLNGYSKEDVKQVLSDSLGNFQTLPLLETALAERQEILFEANLILEHKFDLLGSGIVKMESIVN